MYRYDGPINNGVERPMLTSPKHQEINASRDEKLECVLMRSDSETIAVNLPDVEPVEKPVDNSQKRLDLETLKAAVKKSKPVEETVKKAPKPSDSDDLIVTSNGPRMKEIEESRLVFVCFGFLTHLTSQEALTRHEIKFTRHLVR